MMRPIKELHLSAVSAWLFHSKVSDWFGILVVIILKPFRDSFSLQQPCTTMNMKYPKCLFWKKYVYILQREFIFWTNPAGRHKCMSLSEKKKPLLVTATKEMKSSKTEAKPNKKPVLLGVLIPACHHSPSDNANMLFIYNRFYCASWSLFDMNFSLFCL